MEIIASAIVTGGLIYRLLSSSGFEGDTGLWLTCLILCSFSYDYFFSATPKTAVKKSTDIHSTNLCYVFLVPCAFALSQVMTGFNVGGYHADSNHLALAATVIPVVNQILLFTCRRNRSNSDTYAINTFLLLLSTIPWCVCTVFLYLHCCKWQGYSFATTLYMCIICGCSFVQWTLAKLAPASFSLSEIAIITQGCAIFSYQGVLPLFMTLFKYIKVGDSHIIESFLTNKVADIDVFTEVAVTSAMFVLMSVAVFRPLQNTIGFYLLTFTVMGIYSLPVLYVILKKNFVTWMYEYIMFSTDRTQLFTFWAVICLFSGATVVVIVLLSQEKSGKTTNQNRGENANVESYECDSHVKISMKKRFSSKPRHGNNTGGEKMKNSMSAKKEQLKIKPGVHTVTRKVFHLIAMATFLPGIYYSPPMLNCAATCALIVFSFLECARLLQVWPMGDVLNRYLNTFRDKQDQGPLILTPVYLLVGFTVPFWLHYSGTSDLTLYSGFISLGVGDTLSSAVGSRYGRWKWKGTCKTVEGTLAFVLGSIVCVVSLHYLRLCFVASWLNVSIAVVLTALLEAFTSQIDNLVLPLYMYCFLV